MDIEELAAKVEELEARLQAVEDEREIKILLARHGYNFDCKRDGEWVQLWTDDGKYDLVSTVNYPDGSTRSLDQVWEGPEELQKFVSHPEGHHRPGFYGHSLHTSGNNMVVHIDGDTAVVNSYSFLYQEHDGAVDLVSAASNQWTVKKVGGRWLLQERRRGQMGTPSFAERLDATPA